MRTIFLLFSFLQSGNCLTAQIKLPAFFSSNMVLQRERTIAVWGWASPKEKITVLFNKQTKTSVADKTGKWALDLAAETAGGPYTLTVKGKNTIVIDNILVGDVWVCSGQSNMEMPIGDWGYINNYEAEIASADYPAIRQFLVPRTTSLTAQTTLSGGGWKECTPDNAAAFSATAYFFARSLYKELKVPIGLINSSWGGTQIESWISREAFKTVPDFKTTLASIPAVSQEVFLKLKREKAHEKILAIRGKQIVSADEIATWKSPAYNDLNWHTMQVPGLWEQQEIGNFDGVVWLRKIITITSQDAGKPAILELAMIDDNDETYFNGQKIGETKGYNIARKYVLPAGVLKEGKNSIAVRIDDTGGGGGIYGDVQNVKITIGEKVQPLSGAWLFNIEAISSSAVNIEPNAYPNLLYNSMINTLIPYAIKGVIWYQGEANAGRAYQYRTAFPLMINDWRKNWGQGNFPFYFVQLASWNADNGNSQKGSGWAELREAQASTLSLPNTGMAVTTDIGDPTDIHPKNKQDVGKRLAALALQNTYGINAVGSGPVYKSFEKEGSKITITFSGIGSGLMAKDKYGYLKGFEIAGPDKKFYYARAYITGEKVTVQGDQVANPVAVRFGWADDAGENNLFNKEGFPATPFRTDNWKGITEEMKYKVE